MRRWFGRGLGRAQQAAAATALETPANLLIPSITKELDFANWIAVSNSLSEQIWREQNLVTFRMTWNLSFQAFMTAVYAYVGSNLTGMEKTGVQIILAVGAVFVSLATLGGIHAAQEQSGRLKTHWKNLFATGFDRCTHCGNGTTSTDCNIVSGHFPQPFSPSRISSKGRLASRGICWILILMWLALFVLAILVRNEPPVPKEPGALVTIMSGPAHKAP